VLVSRDGRSVYVTNDIGNGGGTVTEYNIGASGVLTPKTPASIPIGFEPIALATTPDGKSAYVANELGNTIAQDSINPVTGVLSPKTPPTIATGSGPSGIVVTPDGTSAFVTIFNGGSLGYVSQYNIDRITGTLSPKVPATVPAGTQPFDIALGPLPRVHATATSVSCSLSVLAPGDATVCTATVTDTASSGQSTPTGKVSFTHSGVGSLYGSPCVLSGSGVSASCAVFFSSFPRGGQAITASYGGDATHDASVGRTLVAVVLPVSTSGCLVFGHGRLTASNGDQASFRGLAIAAPPRGGELYRDNGPANPFQLASTSVAAVTCSTDARRASVFGTAKLNGRLARVPDRHQAGGLGARQGHLPHPTQ
jgi:hypothetical protein